MNASFFILVLCWFEERSASCCWWLECPCRQAVVHHWGSKWIIMIRDQFISTRPEDNLRENQRLSLSPGQSQNQRCVVNGLCLEVTCGCVLIRLLLLLSQVFLRDRHSRRPQQTSSHDVGTRGTTGDVGKTCRIERRGNGEMKKRVWDTRWRREWESTNIWNLCFFWFCKLKLVKNLQQRFLILFSKGRIWTLNLNPLLFGFVSLSVRPTVRLKDRTFSSRFNRS